MVYSLNVLIII